MNGRVPYVKVVILFVLFAGLGAILFVQWKMRTAETKKPVVVQEKETLSLCVPSPQERLMKKTVDAKSRLSDREKADLIVSHLKKEKAIPDTVSLYDFATDSEGTIYLNVSQDIKSDKVSPMREMTTVFSVVNSFLSNFKDARRVQLLVEGEGLYTLGGLIYTYLPMEFNNQLMED